MKKLKDFFYQWGYLINAGIIALVIGVALICSICLCVANDPKNEAKWNGGYCECGGKWDFTNGSTSRGWTYHFYECETCGEVIKLPASFKK